MNYIRQKTRSRREGWGLSGMVGPAGFEPTTSCTPSKRATRLRYGPKKREHLQYSI